MPWTNVISALNREEIVETFCEKELQKKKKKKKVKKSLYTAQKKNFSIKDFVSKCDQIYSFLGFGHIYWRNS